MNAKRPKLLASSHLILAAITSLLLTGAHARTWTSADGARTFDGELKTYDPATGIDKPFVSGYSSATMPNFWDRSAEVRAGITPAA